LGLPRSIGQIYGLFFISEEPLSLNEVTARLQISKGSASQGLRFLRTVGAIKPVFRPGFRRDSFVPELELRVLLSGLLRERVLPYLDQGKSKLRELDHLDAPATGNEHFRNRVAKLKSWHRQAGTLLPLLSRFIG
jgi:DNA-binding transcriptional regulator GbsR (MarR family)